ncbi:MAG: DUF1460 domain-containing protein [Thermodesulfovibrionia bacterium]
MKEGWWDEKRIEGILRKSSNIRDVGNRIEFISRQFLGIPYKDSTLIGDINTPEVLVINLEAMDCLTFIEYVESMRLSNSFSEFKDSLRRIRYKSGIVQFDKRNHFFTDWIGYNSDCVMDITKGIGDSIEVLKELNKGEDGSYILPGIPSIFRRVRYIPSENINGSLIEKLKTGDYAGIYSLKDGLDVSHVGIIIKDKETVYIRHASKRYGRVIDEEFKTYMSNKPGLIILRPKERS